MRNLIRMVVIVLLLTSLAANLFMYQRWRNRRTVMSVNGHPVSQQDIYDYLVQKEGPTVKLLLTERLMLDDEAAKQKVAPTAAEIQEIFNQERESNWQFARQLYVQPWSEQEVKNGIRQQIEARRLLTAEATAVADVTEDQIKEEYAAAPAKYDTPAKAHTELGLLKNNNDLDKIKELMEKTPAINPELIQQNYPLSVFFIGDNNVFTFYQTFETQQNREIFNMKPDQVQVFPPTQEFAQQGIQKMIVRLKDIVPGKKADLNDPKTRAKVRENVALKRSVPLQQYLVKLWQTKTEFHSENEKEDKDAIGRMLAPDHKNQ